MMMFHHGGDDDRWCFGSFFGGATAPHCPVPHYSDCIALLFRIIHRSIGIVKEEIIMTRTTRTTPIITRQTNKRGRINSNQTLLPDNMDIEPLSLEEMEELEQAKAAQQQRMTVAVHHYATEWARVQPGRVQPQFNTDLLKACPGVTLNAIRSQHRRNIKKMIQKKKATPIDADADTANAAAAAATIMDNPMLDATMSSETTRPVVVIPTPPSRRTASQSPARKKQRYNGGRRRNKGEKLSPTTANAITRVCFLYQQAINETYRHRIRMPKGLLDEIIARVRTELALDDSFTVPNATVSARIRAGNIQGTNRGNEKRKEDAKQKKKKPVVVTTPTTTPPSSPQRGRTASQSPARKKQRHNNGGRARNKGEKSSPHTANAITRVCFLYQQAINETYRHRTRMPKGLLDEIIERVRTELDLDDSFTVPNATVSARIRAGNIDGTNRGNEKRKEDAKKKKPVVVTPTTPPSSPQRGRTASQSPARKKQRNQGGRRNKGEKLTPEMANAITRVCFLYHQAVNETYRNRIRMPKGLLDEIIARVRTELALDDSFTVPVATVNARIRAGNIDGTNRSNAKRKEDAKKKKELIMDPPIGFVNEEPTSEELAEMPQQPPTVEEQLAVIVIVQPLLAPDSDDNDDSSVVNDDDDEHAGHQPGQRVINNGTIEPSRTNNNNSKDE
jgi:hypothetical protein